MAPLIEPIRPEPQRHQVARIAHNHGGLVLLSLLWLFLAVLASQLALLALIVGPAVWLLTLLDQGPTDQHPNWSTGQDGELP